ncbi:transcriptional regulator, IclR family [Kribbella flavida DSM 17836]|uniref:Glycerol operon regulatory protein n=1 Tax=Kribbella flavida (strain DSM 17836 / JCM 10339 / NBRC 14399) TaxID=479435 RepID=D2Q171_KRIFD|nr:IclR family transcriptional regulator [Kribbella flavida]ADB35772.1 transcriptional regulator, IclR family [Kribbella flavida DSM 17836]
MSGNVPASTRTLRVLTFLATQPGPVPMERIASAVGLPRSSTYHLLRAMIDEGFVVHLPEEKRYGLGVAAFEIGSAYLRHDPLERLARPLLAQLVAEVGQTAHLGVLHGRELVYLLKEQPPRPVTLVTDVGVRLPATLTASGRALLAALPPAQVRALFPSPETFVRRTDQGPQTLSQLRRLLADERQQGFAIEESHVTAGVTSVASAALDHAGHPVAAISVSFRSDAIAPGERFLLARRVRQAADALTRRLRG